jgi:hypothetical protein
MLVELAACNAAFSVIKEAVQNSGDLMSAGKALFTYFDNEAALQKRLNSKSGSTVNTDLEEFAALEQIRVQKAELEELMNYAGRAGLLDDWRMFQAKAAKRREEEKREAARAKLHRAKQMMNAFWYSCLAVVLALLMYVGIIAFELFRNRA